MKSCDDHQLGYEPMCRACYRANNPFVRPAGKTLIGTCGDCKWYLRAGPFRMMNEGIAKVCWHPLMKERCTNFDEDDGCNKWEKKVDSLVNL